MTDRDGPGVPWQEIVHAQTRKWGTKQPLTWSELMQDIYGADGRPVREGDSANNPAGVANEHRVLTFPERVGLEGNHSAYESVSGELDQIFATISYLTSVLIPDPSIATFDDRADVVSTLTNLSTFLILREDNPVRNGALSTEIAGFTKVGRGFMKPYEKQSIQQIAERYTGMSSPQGPDFSADADTFMRHIIKHNLLIQNERRATGIACPAPLAIIGKAERILLGEPVTGAAEAGERLGLLNVQEISVMLSVLYLQSSK